MTFGMRTAKRTLAITAAAGLLGVTACGGQETDAANDATGWIDDVVEEAANLPPPAPPSPDWNELPLSDYTFLEGQRDYRVDEIDIPVGANGGALEYKLGLNQGDAVTYTWTVDGLTDPLLFLSEFHGHTERVGGAPGTLMFYRRAVGQDESGMLVAPFTGIHGWYWKNDTSEPVTVKLKVSGFYELIPGQ